MEQKRLWMLFFQTGQPEVYLQICARRRQGRRGGEDPPDKPEGEQPAFRPVQEKKRLV